MKCIFINLWLRICSSKLIFMNISFSVEIRINCFMYFFLRRNVFTVSRLIAKTTQTLKQTISTAHFIICLYTRDSFFFFFLWSSFFFSLFLFYSVERTKAKWLNITVGVSSTQKFNGILPQFLSTPWVKWGNSDCNVVKTSAECEFLHYQIAIMRSCPWGKIHSNR